MPLSVRAILASISPFSERAVLFMNQIMLAVKKAAASMTQPSTMSELSWRRATRTAARTLATRAEPSAQRTVRFSSCAADLRKIGEDDADDERRFDAFSQRDDECLQHVYPVSGVPGARREPSGQSSV